MFRIMDTLDEDLAYTVSLEGIDAFKLVSDALEKPITYLRKKTSSGNSTTISLNSSPKNSYRDVAAEETLNEYEKFITAITESPCFTVNIRAFSNTKTGAELLLAAAAGEAIDEGNAEITTLKAPESLDVILKKQVPYSKMLPQSLQFWPTLFTLEELSPFFRFPILLDGEYIDFPKETQAEKEQDGIPFGKDSKNFAVSLNPKLLKKHAFVCGVPGAGKTNTMLGLCYNLWAKYKIPFLVLEPAKKRISSPGPNQY